MVKPSEKFEILQDTTVAQPLPNSRAQTLIAGGCSITVTGGGKYGSCAVLKIPNKSRGYKVYTIEFRVVNHRWSLVAAFSPTAATLPGRCSFPLFRGSLS